MVIPLEPLAGLFVVLCVFSLCARPISISKVVRTITLQRLFTWHLKGSRFVSVCFWIEVGGSLDMKKLIENHFRWSICRETTTTTTTTIL